MRVCGRRRKAEARVEDEEAQVERKAEGRAPVRLQESPELTALSQLQLLFGRSNDSFDRCNGSLAVLTAV